MRYIFFLNYFIPACLLLWLALGGGIGAWAEPASLQDFFGGMPQLDGSVNVRNPVADVAEAERGVSVADRSKPEYDPTPIPLGSFVLFPSFALGEQFDDNIYATPHHPQGDFISLAHPALNLYSNWGRHALAVTSFADMGFYADHSGENYQNGVLDIQGRYDLAAQSWLNAGAGYQHITIPRSSPDAVAGASGKSAFDVYQTNLGFYRGLGRLQLGLQGSLRDLGFDAAGSLPQSARDRNEWEGALHLGYELSANVTPFVEVVGNAKDYTQNNTRSSTGSETRLGTQVDFSGVTIGKAYVSALYQDYAHLGQTEVRPAYGVEVLSNVTPLTSLRFNAARQLVETDVAGASAVVADTIRLQATHELRRNLLLNAWVGTGWEDFVGAIGRQDNLYDAGAGMRYFFNRHCYGDATYHYSARESSAPGNGYRDDVVLVSLGIRE